jgi:uncharacterized protein YfeS
VEIQIDTSHLNYHNYFKSAEQAQKNPGDAETPTGQLKQAFASSSLENYILAKAPNLGKFRRDNCSLPA